MMASAPTVAVPEHIHLLPNAIAQRHLTMPVLRGDEIPPATTLDQASTAWEQSIRSDARVVRDLVEEAMTRFTRDDRTSADSWLAPRLHATLRITRREASEPGIWNHLASRIAPDYVIWRHLPKPKADKPIPSVNPLRFVGSFHRQAFSRLWWAAELFRDGTDYGPVSAACSNQDILNTALRLDIVHHRPTAQAIVRMLGTGREVNALVKAVNAAGSTLMFDALAPDATSDVDAYRSWIDEAGAATIPYERLPDGPEDGSVDQRVVDALMPLFGQLFSSSPIRGRSMA